MSEPTPHGSEQLDAFVQLLRSATPDEATLDATRAQVMRTIAAPAPGGEATPSPVWADVARIGALAFVCWALAGPHAGWVPPKHAGGGHPGNDRSNAATSSRPTSPGAASPGTGRERDTSASASEPAFSAADADGSAEPSRTRHRVRSDRGAASTVVSTDDGSAQLDAERRRPRGKPGLLPDLLLQLDPAPVPVMAAGPSAPSEAMASAMRDYAGERYAEAAVKLQHVVEGGSHDAPDRVQQAEFFLAKCLYHLELYHASAAAFDEVTRAGRAHPYFDESLQWIAMLAERMPEPSGVIESVSRYDASQLARLDAPATSTHHRHLLYLLGRARYRDGRFEEAVALLRRVPPGTRWSLDARFFEGVSHVRMRRARPALAAFRRVIDDVRAERTGGHEEPERMLHLAWMSVARLYYSLAMQLPDRRDDEASRLLSHAIAAWRRIPLSSEYWLESFFEETWALYVARDAARALGHVHALESPYFRDRASPEALVIRAMIQFEHCQWDAVDHSLSSFHERFDPVLDAAERAHAMADTHENAFRMLVAVRARNSRVPAPVRPIVRASFEDRELMRHLAQVASITAERRRLRGLDEALLESSLRVRVDAELSVMRSFAVDRAGELARARLHRVVADLRERMNQMDTVELELATARRVELERPNPRPMEPPTGGQVWAVQGDQIWPWDGEWWRDELPFYHQEITTRCGR